MKKGIVTADWHIDFNNRMVDTETRIAEVVDYAIEKKVDFFAFVGDAYKNCRPMPVEQEVFQSAIRRVAQAGIQVLLIVGNHDYPNSEDQIHCLSEWTTLDIKGVRVVDKPEYVDIGADEHGKYFALCMPHIPKSIVGKRKYGEVYKEMWDVLWKEYKCSQNSGDNDKTQNVIFLSHALLNGSKLGATDWAIGQGDGVNIRDVLDGRGQDIQMALFGDVHKAQKISNPPYAGYCGSIERIDFGEIADKKGFYYVELRNGAEKIEFINTKATEFVEVVGTIETALPTREICTWVDQAKVDNAIVKVVVTATEEQRKNINDAVVHRFIVTRGARKIASYQVNVVSTERVRNENVNESVNPIEALKEWVGMQPDISQEKKENIIKTGEKILRSVK